MLQFWKRIINKFYFMKNITLYFLRHAESVYNREKIVQGQLDSPLTKEGREMTEKIISKLDKLNLKNIFHSKLRRSRETAEIINKVLNLPIQERSGLEEMHFGDYQSELKLTHWKEFAHQFYSNGEAPPGGENKNDLVKRAENAIIDLCRDLDEDPTLIVSHGMFMRILIGKWFTKWTEKALLNLKTPNLGLYRVDVDFDVDNLVPRKFDFEDLIG